jgi:hypothetical protein
VIVGLGAVRDLIEAGLSEPADAGHRYGISVATPVPGDWLWVTRCARVGGGDAEPLMLVETIDALIGIWVGLRDGASVRRMGSARCRTRGIIASVDADVATPSGSMLGSKRVLMTYQAAVVARCAIAAVWR